MSNNKYYQCPICGYTSQKTYIVFFEDDDGNRTEYRFCAKCYLAFLQGLVTEVPLVIELPAENT